MLKKFPIYVSAAAGVITIILGLITQRTYFEVVSRTVIVIMVAFMCASLVQSYLNAKVFSGKQDEEVLDIEVDNEYIENDENEYRPIVNNNYANDEFDTADTDEK